jgi:hypothetical protein
MIVLAHCSRRGDRWDEDLRPDSIHSDSDASCDAFRESPAGHRRAGFGQRHDHARRETAPTAASEVRRRDQGKLQGFHALVAAPCRAAQGCTQRAAHHDGRPGLWRKWHVWRRDPDAVLGPHRQDGPALHAVPLHRALLAYTGGADHRPQPSLGRLRRHRRIVYRLPGL